MKNHFVKHHQAGIKRHHGSFSGQMGNSLSPYNGSVNTGAKAAEPEAGRKKPRLSFNAWIQMWSMIIVLMFWGIQQLRSRDIIGEVGFSVLTLCWSACLGYLIIGSIHRKRRGEEYKTDLSDFMNDIANHF